MYTFISQIHVTWFPDYVNVVWGGLAVPVTAARKGILAHVADPVDVLQPALGALMSANAMKMDAALVRYSRIYKEYPSYKCNQKH